MLWPQSHQEEAEPQLQGPEQVVWLERLETEHDNLRIALEGCQSEEPAAELGLRLAGALWRFWERHGHLSEGRASLAEALSRKGAVGRTQVRAKALNGAGWLARNQGDNAAAKSFLEESLAIYRELKDKWGIAISLYVLGSVAREQGDFTTARELLEQSLAIYQELGNKQGIADSLLHLGVVASFQGDFGAAMALLEQSLPISREVGDKQGIAFTLLNLGKMILFQGEYGAAKMLLVESLAICRAISSKWGTAFDLEALACLGVATGQAERGVKLWAAAQALRESVGLSLPPNELEEYEREIAAVREALGEEAFAVAWAEGRTMPLEQAIKYALEEDKEQHLPDRDI